MFALPQGCRGGAGFYVQYGSWLLRSVGPKQLVPEVAISWTGTWLGRGGVTDVLGVLHAHTPVLVSSQPGWMGFSKDVLSRESLLFPPTLGRG